VRVCGGRVALVFEFTRLFNFDVTPNICDDGAGYVDDLATVDEDDKPKSKSASTKEKSSSKTSSGKANAKEAKAVKVSVTSNAKKPARKRARSPVNKVNRE
jgi:hypothetical protein